MVLPSMVNRFAEQTGRANITDRGTYLTPKALQKDLCTNSSVFVGSEAILLLHYNRPPKDFLFPKVTQLHLVPTVTLSSHIYTLNGLGKAFNEAETQFSHFELSTHLVS